MNELARVGQLPYADLAPVNPTWVIRDDMADYFTVHPFSSVAATGRPPAPSPGVPHQGAGTSCTRAARRGGQRGG